jgi:hypothetical protein
MSRLRLLYPHVKLVVMNDARVQSLIMSIVFFYFCIFFPDYQFFTISSIQADEDLAIRRPSTKNKLYNEIHYF